jgi:GNAT superfamily N-acetyltransferase
VDEVGGRFEAVARAADHSLFVAEQDGKVVGLLHLYARPALDKPPEAILQALVVDEVARGSGAGRRLMETAERWAGQRSFTSVALASHIARSGAHAFYERLGYRIEATSHLMRKRLTK